MTLNRLKLTVQVQQPYPIYIHSGLLSDLNLLKEHIAGTQVMLVTNATVAQLYLDKFSALKEAYQCDTIILPDGEEYKNLTELNKIFNALITHKHTRSTTLIALGGGVIGDMTGFAAACYMRGVNFLQIPTSLLAQVDASIGGKTAVNHEMGKNLIGAFHQPRAIFIDPFILSTLPKRIFQEGLAEVIKYGLIQDADFFVWLETHIQALLDRDEATLTQAIIRSCEIKAAIVAADEHEQSDIRAWLNFGHTFAHAIESGLGYGQWLHGEAVAIGMLIAADLSAQLNLLPLVAVHRIRALLIKAGLPVKLPASLLVPRLLGLMAGDKKNIHRRLRLVLLAAIGKAVVTEDVQQSKLEQVLLSYLP